MKLVRVEVLPAKDGETVIATIIEQRNEGGSWREIERHVVKSNEVGAQRTLLLEDNERIIVDGRTQTEVVMINNTVMAVPAAAPLVAQVEPAAGGPGPLPPGEECQIGVWREADEQDWSRTGKRYRIY